MLKRLNFLFNKRAQANERTRWRGRMDGVGCRAEGVERRLQRLRNGIWCICGNVHLRLIGGHGAEREPVGVF